MWKQSLIERTIRRFLLLVIVICAIAPIVLIIMTSFKTRVDALASPPVWFFKPTLSNYIEIFKAHNFKLFFYNSSVVAIVSTLVTVFIASLSAYGFARYSFRGKEGISYWILSLRMAPPIAAIIPFFFLLRMVHLIDSRLGLIIVYININLPFAIWMLRGFFEDIPKELEESAKVDGCTALGSFFRIAIPLIKPGLAATTILTFLFIWNEFLFALILTGWKAQTLPVAVTLFMRETGIDWGYLAAASTLMMIPAIMFTFLAQKGLVRGLTLGAIK